MSPAPASAPATGAGRSAGSTHATVLVYAVPNTALCVLVDGIADAADLAQAQEIAQHVVSELGRTPLAQRRSRVLRVDHITDMPPLNPNLTSP